MGIGNNAGIGFQGIGFPGGGGTPTPQPVTISTIFGRKTAIAAFNAASTDTFDGIYMLKKSGVDSIADAPAFYRARAGDVLKSITFGVGFTAAGTVSVGLYVADTMDGPWTLVQQSDKAVAPSGTNTLVNVWLNLNLAAGKYYYLAGMSASAEFVQYPLSGGSEKWTAATPMTSPLADADGSTSNYVIELYGTVERVVQP